MFTKLISFVTAVVGGGLTAKSLHKIFQPPGASTSADASGVAGTSQAQEGTSASAGGSPIPVNIARRLDNVELFKTLIEDYKDIKAHIQHSTTHLPSMEITFNTYRKFTEDVLKNKQEFINSLGTHFDLPRDWNYINQERITRLTKDLSRIKGKYPKETEMLTKMENIISGKIEAIRLEMETSAVTSASASAAKTQYVETIPSPGPTDGGGGGNPWSWVGVMLGVTLLVFSVISILRGEEKKHPPLKIREELEELKKSIKL